MQSCNRWKSSWLIHGNKNIHTNSFYMFYWFIFGFQDWVLPKLASNSWQSSYLSLPSAGITGVYLHTSFFIFHTNFLLLLFLNYLCVCFCRCMGITGSLSVQTNARWLCHCLHLVLHEFWEIEPGLTSFSSNVFNNWVIFPRPLLVFPNTGSHIDRANLYLTK